MKKIVLVFAGLGLIGAGAAALGSSRIAGQRVDVALDELVGSLSSQGLIIERGAHQAKLLGSEGTLKLAWSPLCGADGIDRNAFELEMDLNYRTDHRSSLLGRAAFELELLANGELAELLAETDQRSVLLGIVGSANGAGDVEARINNPRLLVQNQDLRLELDAGGGTLELQGERLKMDYTLPSLVIGDESATWTGETRFSVEQLAVELERDSFRELYGVGGVVVRIGQADLGPLGRAEGIELSSAMRPDNGRMSVQIRHAVDELLAMGQPKFNNAVLQMALDTDEALADAVTQYAAIFGTLCQPRVDAYDADPQAYRLSLDRIVRKLVDGGIEIRIPELHAETPQGPVDGQLSVAFAPAAEGGSALMRLEGEGELFVADGLLPPGLAMEAISGGLVESQDGQLGVRVQLQQGQFNVNGQPDPMGLGPTLQMNAPMFDEFLAAWAMSLEQGQPMLFQDFDPYRVRDALR